MVIADTNTAQALTDLLDRPLPFRRTPVFAVRDTYQAPPADPIALHKYLYCGADPINGSDPSGMFDLGSTLATATMYASEFTTAAGVASQIMGEAMAVVSAMDWLAGAMDLWLMKEGGSFDLGTYRSAMDAQTKGIALMTSGLALTLGGLGLEMLGGVLSSAAVYMGMAFSNHNAGCPISIVGRYPDYLNFGGANGFNYFSIPPNIWSAMTPQQQWAANQSFLDQAIACRNSFTLTESFFKMPNTCQSYKEVQYLLDHGYELINNGMSLVFKG